MRYRSNEKGGAAIVAVMIMIMILAVGSAVMVVTGKGKVGEAATIPAVAEKDSSSEDDNSSEPEEPEPDPEPEPEPVKLMAYPEKSLNYRDIKLDELTAEYGILIDADNHAILAGEKYDEKVYPASLTKVMTLVVAAENMEDLEQTFTFTADIIDPLVEENASRAGFEAGETVTYEDLLYSSILVSGADGTTGLAIAVAGSEEEFVKLMNEKAEELGLTGTHFVNASGLHDDDHYSTCRDLAMILEYAMKNEKCREILTTDYYVTSETDQHEYGIELYSILARRLNGYWVEGGGEITGGKTGFTDEAKYTLATICEKDDHDYVCVTAKSTGEWTSVEDNIAIYEHYLPGMGTDEEGAVEAVEDDSPADDSSNE